MVKRSTTLLASFLILAALRAAGQGFATTATNWSLPVGGQLYSSGGTTTNYGFDRLSSSGSSYDVAGSQTWSVLDVNGDAKPDLVVHTQKVTATGGFLPFGTAPNRYWKVYLGTNTGFATTATSWTLPVGGQLDVWGGTTTDYGFDRLAYSGYSSDAVGSQTWSVLDVNGDAKPDLVVHTQKVTATGGFLPFGTAPNRYWKVYLNTGQGFATTATNWTLPVGGQLDVWGGTTTDYGFDRLAYSGYSSDAVGSQTWSVLDVNGDAKPDLVVHTQKVTATDGYLLFGTAPNRYWKVYLNTGQGFATTATNWTLPVGGQLFTYGGPVTDYGFNGLSSSGGSFDAVGSQTWSVLDVNGDAKPDLVVHAQKPTATGGFLPFGTAPNRYWKAYLGTNTGFATTATNWAQPVGGQLHKPGSTIIDYGFDVLSFSGSSYDVAGSQTWSVLDVNGDAKPDLVVHAQKPTATDWYLPFGTAPNRYWKVYLGRTTPLATTVSTTLADGVTLYPNPTNGQITLSGPVSLAGQPYTMVDVLGRTLRTGISSAAELTLNVQALPAGVYGVRIGTDSHLLRFVKQ